MVNVTQKGKPLWHYKLPEIPISIPNELDLYNNSKIQYAITTATNVVVVDRLGRAVEKYPLKFSDSTNTAIEFLKVKGKTCFLRIAKSTGLYDAKTAKLDDEIELPFDGKLVDWKLENQFGEMKLGLSDSVLFRLNISNAFEIDTLFTGAGEMNSFQSITNETLSFRWCDNEGIIYTWNENRVDTQKAFAGEKPVYIFDDRSSTDESFGFIKDNEVRIVNADNSLKLLKKIGESPIESVQHLSSRPHIFYFENSQRKGFVFDLDNNSLNNYPQLQNVVILKNKNGGQMILGVKNKQLLAFQL